MQVGLVSAEQFRTCAQAGWQETGVIWKIIASAPPATLWLCRVFAKELPSPPIGPALALETGAASPPSSCAAVLSGLLLTLSAVQAVLSTTPFLPRRVLSFLLYQVLVCSPCRLFQTAGDGLLQRFERPGPSGFKREASVAPLAHFLPTVTTPIEVRFWRRFVRH